MFFWLLAKWCTMQFKTTEDLGIFVNLTADHHLYSGPTELTQYFVRGTKLYMQKTENDLYSVVFEMALGRRLTATFLTAFLPTILLNVIGHATNYFKTFFFEEQGNLIDEHFYPDISGGGDCKSYRDVGPDHDVHQHFLLLANYLLHQDD